MQHEKKIKTKRKKQRHCYYLTFNHSNKRMKPGRNVNLNVKSYRNLQIIYKELYGKVMGPDLL